MEKRRKSYNEMYDYVSGGNTLYDFLKGYVDIEDFSAKTVLNVFRRDLNMQQGSISINNQAQFNGLVNTYNSDIHGRIVDSMNLRIRYQDRMELLKRLQEVNPEKYDFPDLLQYINFLEDVNFTPRAIVQKENEEGETETTSTLDPDIEKMNTILIDTAVENADPELVARIRNVLIHMILIPYARKQILNENPEIDPVKNPKLEKILLLRRIFSESKLINEYDKAIAYSKEREDEAVRKARLETDCKMRRLASLADYTGKTMSEVLEVADSKDKYVIDLITNNQQLAIQNYSPREGDYHWSFTPDSRPQVVLNEPVEFSDNGVENQDVVVISYGDFMYGKEVGAAKFNEYPMRLIGVTVFGNDENKNYFFVTPESNIGKMRNKDYSEYYKKVLLSTTVLDESISHRERFLPELSIDEDGNASLEYEGDCPMLDLTPLNALKYANRFPGFLGREKGSATLQEFCNSQQLFELQMKLVSDLRARGIYDKDTGREDY